MTGRSPTSTNIVPVSLTTFYDAEASHYDTARGGKARARAAADALDGLLPDDAEVVLDLAGGTGIVSALLVRSGRAVVVLDRSAGMARVASGRLPGRVVLGEGTCLPVADRSVPAVTIVWLLHLLEASASSAVLAEAARVLRPGGVLVTTVDKSAAVCAEPSDVADVLTPALPRRPADGMARIIALAGGLGLVPAGTATFVGHGQGRSPRRWRDEVLDPRSGWACRGGAGELALRLAELPDQDVPRPDPVYHLLALSARP